MTFSFEILAARSRLALTQLKERLRQKGVSPLGLSSSNEPGSAWLTKPTLAFHVDFARLMRHEPMVRLPGSVYFGLTEELSFWRLHNVAQANRHAQWWRDQNAPGARTEPPLDQPFGLLLGVLQTRLLREDGQDWDAERVLVVLSHLRELDEVMATASRMAHQQMERPELEHDQEGLVSSLHHIRLGGGYSLTPRAWRIFMDYLVTGYLGWASCVY